MLACVVSHFIFHLTFPHSNFVVAFLSIYACASWSTDRAEWLYEMSRLGQPRWFAFQKRASTANEPARFQFTSYKNEAISTELTTDCRVGFKMMQNNVPSYKQATLPHVNHFLSICLKNYTFIWGFSVQVLIVSFSTSLRFYFCSEKGMNGSNHSVAFK